MEILNTRNLLSFKVTEIHIKLTVNFLEEKKQPLQKRSNLPFFFFFFWLQDGTNQFFLFYRKNHIIADIKFLPFPNTKQQFLPN